MPRQTKEEKRIKELEDQIEFMSKEFDAQSVRNGELENQSKTLKRLVDNLQQEINRLNDNFEADSDPSKQTIVFCTQLLIGVFNKIKCPITRRESFKQFVAAVVDGDETNAKQKESELKEAMGVIEARFQSLDNTKEFLQRIVTSKVKYF